VLTRSGGERRDEEADPYWNEPNITVSFQLILKLEGTIDLGSLFVY
jgi:hypothetical protein